MTSKEVESAIIDNCNFRAICWIFQLRVGTGFGEDGERTMDMWGMEIAKKPWRRICVEVKVSRGDFVRDLRSPLKQRRARLLANEFYYAAPKDIIEKKDLPIWAGLIEVDGGYAKIAVEAPWFDSVAPTWRFIGQILRRNPKALLPSGTIEA